MATACMRALPRSSFFVSSPPFPLPPPFLPVFSAKPGARNAQDLNLFYLSWKVKIAEGKDVLWKLRILVWGSSWFSWEAGKLSVDKD